jgi:hypothetical protein
VETVAEAWHRALPNDPRPLLRLMRDAEGRQALKKALRYLERGEELDGLSPEVRRARFRLLARSAIRYLKQGKTRLAKKELSQLEDLPQARENDRPAAICSRCGADLAPLMKLAASAWRLRQSARRAIEAGDFADAGTLADQAQGLHATPAGRSLWLLAAWSARQRLPE